MVLKELDLSSNEARVSKCGRWGRMVFGRAFPAGKEDRKTWISCLTLNLVSDGGFCS